MASEYDLAMSMMLALDVQLPSQGPDPSIYSSGGDGGWGGIGGGWGSGSDPENGSGWDPFSSPYYGGTGGMIPETGTAGDFLEVWDTIALNEPSFINEDVGGPARFNNTTELKSQQLAGSTDTISVSFDANANQSVTQSMALSFYQVVDGASLSGVSPSAIWGVRVSSTSEYIPGVHELLSNHGVGDAVDISSVNNVHISNSGLGMEYAVALESAALLNPNITYVEGPVGNFFRATPESPWQLSAALNGMNTHVHIEVFGHH